VVVDRMRGVGWAGRATALAVGLAAGVTLVPAGAALADAGTNASCMGHEASGISPPGSSGELPGGMPELKRFFDETLGEDPPGVAYRSIAKLHEGSHEACDEAFE
jgi:hypothetical protein